MKVFTISSELARRRHYARCVSSRFRRTLDFVSCRGAWRDAGPQLIEKIVVAGVANRQGSAAATGRRRGWKPAIASLWAPPPGGARVNPYLTGPAPPRGFF
jgi:hypothetical protein